MEDRATPATVNTTDDTHDVNPGDGNALDANGHTSLRAAVEEANALGGSQTINFGLTGTNTITLHNNNGPLDLNTADITINGPGQTSLYITKEPDDAVLFTLITVQNGSTSVIKNLTLTGGKSNGSGGAIWNDGNLTVEACTISYNQANAGGGIANERQLVVNNCVVLGNSATTDGGGLYCAATANSVTRLTSTIVRDNTAVKGGGIAVLAQASLTATGGTIDLNWAGEPNGVGGGLYVSGGTITLTGCNINENSAPNGAGLYNSAGNCTLRSLTVSDNQASSWGGGIYAKLGSTTMEACTFAGNGDMGGGPKVAYKGVLGNNTFITADSDCVGIDSTDFVPQP